jgi:hypothetical protein
MIAQSFRRIHRVERTNPRPRTRVLLSLLAILVAAAALRLFLLAGPQTELEADESIVGLMARHILRGEWPLFYYMQPYMGSLEAYLVAGVFALVGSSTLALKLVPMIGALLFVALLFATGYRLGGLTAAVVAGLFGALPPAFLAIWSLKARGGYIEILVMGQLLILMAMDFGKRRQIGRGRGFLMGLIAGLGLWTNPLIAVYLIPIAIYLILVLRSRVLGGWLLGATAGLLLGSAPLIGYNLATGFATGNLMDGGDGSGLEYAPDYLRRVLRLCLPILAGLFQGSSSPRLFGDALEASPLNRAVIAQSVAVPFFALLLYGARRLPAVVRRRAGEHGELLLSLLMVVVPAIFVVTRFREMISEPRYLLPLYSTVPLLGSALASVKWPGARKIGLAAFALVIAANLIGIGRLDPRLNLPDTVIGSTAANRAELADFLLSRGMNRVYTDYWLAYPLAFESREQVVPSVMSGGFNRYIPYAYQVKVALNPAFVFIKGSKEESVTLQRWTDAGVEARRERVSIYTVYWDARPLDRARP